MSISERAKGFEAGQKASERPALVTEEHLTFLDDLRETGVTNMFGARPYVMGKFPELSEAEASEVLGYWMMSFGKPDR